MARIVVGVNGSEGAAGALRWAVQEGRVRGWPVVAVMAWGYLDQRHLTTDARFDPSYGSTDARTALDEAVESALGDAGAWHVERHVVCDLATRALLEAVGGGELLVVGARGHGGFRGLLMGSVSEQCLHHMPCLVAVVRPHDDPRVGGTMQRIVVGIDGSDTARDALQWALDEARLRRAAITVVQAWAAPYATDYTLGTVPVDVEVFECDAHQSLDAAVDGANTSGLSSPVERVLVCGGASSAILEAAKGADLVVVGSRGLGGFSGLLLGSVSHQITHHAPCPVVVVPPADQTVG